MKMCEYKFRNGEKCGEEALKNSRYCILHIDLPEDEESKEFERINKLKEKKVEEKVNKGDFNFEGAKLLRIDFHGVEIRNSLNFADAVIRTDAQFTEAKIGKDARFDGAKIRRNVGFNRAKINGDAHFGVAEIGGLAWFSEAKIGGDAQFDRAKIDGDIWFHLIEIKGKLSFKNAWFRIPRAQEEACRKAKKTL